MKEWLTVIIVLLIIGVLLDGFRRMRAHRRESVRLSKNMMEVDALMKDDQISGSEFPSGGARVVGYREPTDTENIHQNVRESYAASRLTRGAKRIPGDDGNLDTPVPLMQGNDDDSEFEQEEHEDWREPTNEEFDFEPAAHKTPEPTIGDIDDLDDATPAPRDAPPQAGQKAAATSEQYAAEPEPFNDSFDDVDEQDDSAWDEPTPVKAAERQDGKGAFKRGREPAPEPEEARAPDEVLVINVMAKREEVFLGQPLLDSMVGCGLRYGDMDIFHRYETEGGKGKVLFSLANMVKPGTFDLEGMEQFSTPGVCLFLTLPSPGNSLEAFDLMAETAQTLAKDLGGELKDENRSVMTRQTIEHGRARVMEYERKRRLAKA